MKRLIILCCLIAFAFTLVGCKAAQYADDKDKYTMNASIAMGAADKNSLDKTKVTYEITISGKKEDISNIESQELLINTEYRGLVLEDGPHSSQVKIADNPYLKITGSYVFDTKGKSKAEISEMRLLEGVKLIEKDKDEVILKFNEKLVK